jgi:hypothetical protein
MQIQFPEQPLPSAHFELGDGSLLRDAIKTAAANGVPFRLLYNDGKRFRYPCAPSWYSR